MTPADQTAYRERSIAINLVQFAQKAGNRHRGWTKQELALLGTASDAEVAAKIGRSETAVRAKRTKLGIPSPVDRQSRHFRSGGGREAAERAGHTSARNGHVAGDWRRTIP